MTKIQGWCVTGLASAITALLAACGGSGGGGVSFVPMASAPAPAPGGSSSTAPAPAPAPVASFEAQCGALAGLPLANGKLVSAVYTAGVTNTASPASSTPDHCLVRGELNPRTGVDGKPYAILFELRLPKDWN